MAQVIDAYRLYDEPQTAEESWNESDRTTTSEYTKTWQAVTDVATSDPMVISQSSYVPQRFEPDPDNPDAGVIRRRIERTKNRLHWNIDVTYSTRAPSQQDGDDNGSPLGAKVKWSIRREATQMPMWSDLDDNYIKNTADQPFVPPVMIARSLLVFQAITNKATYPAVEMMAYNDHVNSVDFLGCPPGTLMCAISSAEQEYSMALKYWKMTYEFHYDYRGWQPKILSAGFMQWDETKSKHVAIKDGAGQEVTEPWPLSEAGRALTSSDLRNPLTGVRPAFVNVKGYHTADFNQLGLVLP